MGRYDSFFEDDTTEELLEHQPIIANPAITESVAPTASFSELSDTEPQASDVAETMPDRTANESLHAVLPTTIANRPATSMKTRYSGHALFNDLVRKDWQRAIAADPYSFDALLYLPIGDEWKDIDPDDGDQGVETHSEPSFTEISNNQKTLEYGDPILVAVLDCPDERPEFNAMDSDVEQDGSVDDVLILRIAPPLSTIDSGLDEDGADHPIVRAFVPVGSILEWNESLSSGKEVRRWWYVHRIYTYGTAAVGSLYYCIPARNFDGIPEGGQ